MLADPSQLAGIRRGGEANVDGIEVSERSPVGIVDGAVALVRNHEVKVSVPKAAGTELARNRIE